MWETVTDRTNAQQTQRGGNERAKDDADIPSVLFVAAHRTRGGGYSDFESRVRHLDVHIANIVLVDAGSDVKSAVSDLFEDQVSVSTGVGLNSCMRRVQLTLSALYQLWSILRSTDVDIVSTSGYKAALLASLVVPFTSAKLVVRVHAKRFYRSYPAMSRYISHVADRTLHVSDYTAKLAWPWERSVVVRSPIETTSDIGQGDGTTVREEFEANNGLLLGLIGRVEPIKGHKYLLNIVPQLKETYEDLTVLVVGDTDMANSKYLNDIQTIIERKNLEDVVVFTGFREDIPDILDALDVLLVPSKEENIPKVIQEALLAETPVVAHDVGGINELVTTETGWLVPAGDRDALYDAINTVLSSPEAVAKKVARGKEVVREKHRLSRIIDQEERVYHRLLECQQ